MGCVQYLDCYKIWSVQTGCAQYLECEKLWSVQTGCTQCLGYYVTKCGAYYRMCAIFGMLTKNWSAHILEHSK